VLCVWRSVLKRLSGGGKKPEEETARKEEKQGTPGERTSVPEVIPADEYLGIDRLPYKMTREMMNMTAFWGQNQSSFKQAEEVTRGMFNFGITDDHIRKVT
jgi:hypothetical protein